MTLVEIMAGAADDALDGYLLEGQCNLIAKVILRALDEDGLEICRAPEPGRPRYVENLIPDALGEG